MFLYQNVPQGLRSPHLPIKSSEKYNTQTKIAEAIIIIMIIIYYALSGLLTQMLINGLKIKS